MTRLLLLLAAMLTGPAHAETTWQQLVERSAHRIILDHDQLAIDAAGGMVIPLKHATTRAAQMRRVAEGLKHWPANPTNPRLGEFTKWAGTHFWDAENDEGMRLWLDRACQLQDIELAKAAWAVNLKQRVPAHAVLDVWLVVANSYIPPPPAPPAPRKREGREVEITPEMIEFVEGLGAPHQ